MVYHNNYIYWLTWTKQETEKGESVYPVIRTAVGNGDSEVVMKLKQVRLVHYIV